jgi:hypothetical protein
MLARTGLLVAAALLAAACRNQDEDGATALWDEFHADEYRTWARAPGFPGRTPSSASHGDAVDIYINDVLAEALASGEALSEWPEGSLIVKDGFKDGEPLLVAAMEKSEGGWFWAEYKADGEVDFSGSPKVCTGCHDAGADYVRAFGFPD